jgi:hypothetical protein
MAAAPAMRSENGDSFLLQLLHYAGWRLRVRNGETVTIRAVRDDVVVDVTGASLPEAAGVAFARAMRSGSGRAKKGERQGTRATDDGCRRLRDSNS